MALVTLYAAPERPVYFPAARYVVRKTPNSAWGIWDRKLQRWAGTAGSLKAAQAAADIANA